MQFDVAGALKAGATPDQIAQFLAEKQGFDLDGALGAGASVDQVIGFLAKPAKEPESRHIGAVLNDTVISIANAAAGGVAAAGDAISPGNRFSKFIDENIVKAGEASQSDAVKAGREKFQREVAASDGLGDEAAAVGRYLADSPLQAAGQAFGSFAGPGLAIKGARGVAGLLGLGARGTVAAGTAAGVATGAAMGGGDAGGEAYDLVMATPDDVLLQNDAVRAEVAKGRTLDEVKEEAAVSAARKASVLPAIAGGVSGAFGVERFLSGGKGFGGGLISRAVKSGLSEAVPEGLEEGLASYTGQAAAAAYDPSIDPMKGVGASATLGAALGLGPGMAAGVLDGVQSRRRAVAEQALQQATDAASAAAAANEMASVDLDAAVNEVEQAVSAYLRPDGGIPTPDQAMAQPTIETPQPLTPQEKQELARQQLQSTPVIDPLAELRLQVNPSTTMADVAQRRDAVETSAIERMMAEDMAARPAAQEIAPPVATPAPDLAQASAQETTENQLVGLEQKTRERMVNQLMEAAAEPSGYFASRMIPAIDQQLAVLKQPPLTPQERERVVGLTGAAQAFTKPKLPESPFIPDTGADNTSLEARIPEKIPRPSRILGQPTSSYTDDQLTRMIDQPDIPAVSRRGASIELSARQAVQSKAATLTNEGEMANAADTPADQFDGMALPEQIKEYLLKPSVTMRQDGKTISAKDYIDGLLADGYGNPEYFSAPKGSQAGFLSKPGKPKVTLNDKQMLYADAAFMAKKEKSGSKQKQAGAQSEQGQDATLTNEGTKPAIDPSTLAAKQRWEQRQAEEKQQAAQNQQENERYNAYVQEQEKDAERSRLQGDNIIQQANGKPFKTEASAQAKLDEFDLADTHAIQKTDKGFVLRRMPPAEQAEQRRKAEGRESYMEAQAAVLAEMGIGETADGEIDATDEQFAEIERRTAQRLGRNAQPADSKPNQPPAQQTPAVAATETVAQTAPIQLGRDQTPLAEGGKPFKTRTQAAEAKKLQPMMRVVSVPGGYALAEKTPAQIAAQEKAAQRLRQARTSPKGEPIPAHAFIAANGGMQYSTKSDMGVDGNPRIGNRSLFAAAGRGLSIERATEMLVAEGYLSQGASHNDAYAIIKKSLTQPQYNADGIERIAEMESAAQFEDYLAAQEEMERDPWEDVPAILEEYTADELQASGYDAAPDAIKAEVQALLEMADARGIDGETILLQAHEQTRNATEQDYYEASKSALEEAIQGSPGNRSTLAGRQGEEGTSEGLTAPTRDDILASQDRASNERALQEREQIRRESEAGAGLFELTMEDGRQDTTGALFSRERGTETPRGSKLATPSDGRIVNTDATATGKAPVPGSKHTVQDGETSHSFTVVDSSKLGTQGRLIQQIARIFGKRVVAFQSDTLQADGFVMNDDQTSIYLNVESTVSPMAVFGHELTHQMKRDNPQAYAALEAVVERNMGEDGMTQFRQEYGEEADIEELSSDLVGNRFREPAFWEDVFNEIAAQNPTGAAAIVQRVGQAIRKAVDTLLKTIRQQGFNADAYVTNLEEIRDAVRVAMVDYAKQQREPARAGVKDAPVVGRKAKFSFAGRESKTADARQLDEAQRLIASGTDPEAVRQQTGWFKGADGKWRYEINDADAKLLKEPSDPEVYADVFDEAASRSNGVPLANVLDHPALFAAYPKLRATRLIVDDKADSDGSYSVKENAIRVRDPYSYEGGPDKLLSVLLHEIQHGIQTVEGFATGANPDQLAKEMPEPQAINDAKLLARRMERGESAYEARQWFMRMLKRDPNPEGAYMAERYSPGEILNMASSPLDAYKRSAGEVEARNTQARQKMTDAERQATSPNQTADVADSDVIVMFNGKVAKNAPMPANAPEGAQFSRKRTDTDAEYMAAVERGDMETAQKLVDQAALAAGYITANDYRMQHQAPNSQYDTNLANLREEGLVPDDYWTNPEWYQNTTEEMESWRKVKDAFRRMDAYKANGRNPGMAGIDVYRAVPKDVKDSEIRNGDWVTPSLAYAKNEGEMIPGGYRIIAQKVLAKDLYWDGNSMAELGYDDGQGYGYKNTKNNRKLVDVITRDDDGNIIALSKRFNSRVADTRFSRRRNIYGQQVLPTWTAPTETKLDDFLYVMQDKMVDTKRVVEAVKGAIGRIDDQWNPYLQEELYHGRTATKTKQFLGDELRPLLQDMQSRGVGMADFEEYLHNRHAEERNQQIAKVNPGMQDGGSGIDTADARAYLAGLDPTKRRAYEALARRIDAITAGTRQLLVDNGLETQDTIDAWDAAYSQYVPLNREDLDFSSSFTSTGTGQGFSVKGAASKRATGSKRKVVDILANIAMQRERAIVRAEKNRVATAVYGLAASQPNTDFWLAVNPDAIKDPIGLRNELVKMGLNPLDAQNLIEEPTQTYIDPRTGLVSQRINPALRSSPNVLAVRVDGKDRYVFFNASDERSQRMVTALKNLDADQLGRVMGMAAQVTRWFASVNTQYNPIFGAINFMRDVQGAALQLSTTPIADMKAQVVGDVIPALRGIYADIRAERKGNARPGGKWSALWEEFQKEGAQTGYRDQFSKSAERAQALESELKRITEGKAKQFGRAMFDWLSDYNETMENAVRLAAYKAAKDNGLSNQQAASVAKNLTVNFNRKGQIATQAGALYAFFNAAIQGSTRLVQTLTGPAGKTIIGGGLLLGVIQAVMLAAAGYDDDEPPEFARERGFIIPMDWLNNIGGPDLDGKYFTIPMPLGYNVIPNTSRVMTEFVLSGYRDPAKRVAQITGALLETFNPIGNAGWSVQTIAPTFADPLVALSENRDWTGKMIAKKDRSDTNPTPGYTRAKETASWFSKELSYYLNLASGGTKYKPGFLSPTPDQIDYLIGQVTGGVGREALKIEQTITSTVTGEELPPYKIPLAGRFYGDTKSASAESNRFYENITRLNEHENEIKGRRENRENPGEYLRENPEARLYQFANKIEQDVTKLRKRRRELLERGASKESIKMIETQITNRMKRLNDRVKAVQDAED